MNKKEMTKEMIDIAEIERCTFNKDIHGLTYYLEDNGNYQLAMDSSMILVNYFMDNWKNNESKKSGFFKTIGRSRYLQFKLKNCREMLRKTYNEDYFKEIINHLVKKKVLVTKDIDGAMYYRLFKNRRAIDSILDCDNKNKSKYEVLSKDFYIKKSTNDMQKILDQSNENTQKILNQLKDVGDTNKFLKNEIINIRKEKDFHAKFNREILIYLRSKLPEEEIDKISSKIIYDSEMPLNS